MYDVRDVRNVVAFLFAVKGVKLFDVVLNVLVVQLHVLAQCCFVRGDALPQRLGNSAYLFSMSRGSFHRFNVASEFRPLFIADGGQGLIEQRGVRFDCCGHIRKCHL